MNVKLLSIPLTLITIFSIVGCTPAETTQSVESTPAEETTAVPETISEVEFSETTLVDDDNCTFIVTGIDYDNIWGYTINAYLENKTDKELMFSLDNTSVNGYMCSPVFATTVSPAMKSNEEISWSPSDFEQCGIENVTDIEFDLSVYDSEDWSGDYLVNETYQIFPLGEDAATTYERTPQDTDIVLFDNDKATMTVTGYDPENIWGYTVDVYIENKTDESLMFSTDGCSVNGFMCDPFWATSVAPGKKEYSALSFSSSDFETNGITSVETVTLPVTVYSADDYSLDYYVDETFTLTPLG